MLCIILVLLSACDALQATSTPSISTPDNRAESTPTTPENVTRSTPTAFVYPEPATRDDPCAVGLPTRLILHERGRVADEDDRPLNMREGPDVDFEQIQQLAINSVFLVLDGPECTDDYIWYYIRYEDAEGWIAEGERGIYYVEPYFTG